MHPDAPRATPPSSPQSQSQPQSPESPHGPPPPPQRERLSLLRTPVATGVIVASIIVYVITRMVFPNREDPFTLYGPLVAVGEWWRVLGTAVQHGSLLHIAMNMFAVYSLGRAYEYHLGTARFAQISLITALASSAAVLWFSFDQPTVGASGMILGWVGAVLPITKGSHREELISLVVLNALISFMPQVSWQGHLGGFVGGLLCGLVLRRGGAKAFRYAAPILTFAAAALTVVAVRAHS